MERKTKVVDKPWGKFEEFTTNEKCTVKIISVAKGGVLSLQSHENRDELWVALDDGLIAVIGGREIPLKKGEEAFVARKTKHRMKASENARFLEISFGDFDEEDITRHEDEYGRV